MNTWIVKCSALSIDVNRAAYKGDVVTDEDLDGMDIERLVSIGAIAANRQSAGPAVNAIGTETEEDGIVIDSKMSRRELDVIATDLGIVDADKLPNKDAVIEAISAKVAENEQE